MFLTLGFWFLRIRWSRAYYLELYAHLWKEQPSFYGMTNFLKKKHFLESIKQSQQCKVKCNVLLIVKMWMSSPLLFNSKNQPNKGPNILWAAIFPLGLDQIQNRREKMLQINLFVFTFLFLCAWYNLLSIGLLSFTWLLFVLFK